ncbi:PIG-L family deacetylase [Ruania suaedae]|uniref:PIG-L family deacetylase n=1 Tax=Ruania suaedae TaxID=2897774 RepID=UPI001E5EA5B9|nr:PIG-L family deacetylase [Ruania suaedae]UFU02287.1 PIG-L family deacetylase [Ruania suaedae]
MTADPEPDRLRVLAGFAHPDDETITGGGILAWLARGAEVHVVTANRGERGEVIPGDIAHLEGDGPALAQVREGELAGALAALGVAGHTFLDALPGLTGRRRERYTDSGMQWEGDSHVRAVADPGAGRDALTKQDREIAARLLAAHMRRMRPHLVLSDEPGGGYGHPDHVRMHEIVARAVELALEEDLEPIADDDPCAGLEPWRVPVVAWVVRAESSARAAAAWLSRSPARPRMTGLGRSLAVADPDAELASIVRPDAQVDLVVDTSEVTDRVAAAMRAHRSQVQDVGLVSEIDGGPVGSPADRGSAVGWFALSNEVLQPLQAEVGLAVAPGWGSPTSLRGALAAAEVPAIVTDEPDDGAGEHEHVPGWYVLLMRAFTGLLGVVMAAAATAFHRWEPPFGVMLSLLAIICSGTLSRAFADRLGVLVHAVAVVATVLALTYLGPGGDVIVTDEPIGTIWLVGSVVVTAVPALLPRRWFRDGH